MRRRNAALLFLLLAPVAAASQPLPPLAPVSGVLVLEGKQVALPEGEWRRAATVEGTGGLEGVVSVALLQLRDGEVVGGVLVQANKAGAPSDWGQAHACARTDLPLARVRYASDHDGSCAYVAAVTVTGADATAVDPAWAAAGAAAQARGWTMPASWAEAGIRVSDPLAAVQVRYAFARRPGAPFPPGLTGWTGAAWDAAEHGLLNLLDPVRSLPPLTQAEPAPPEPEQGGGVPRAVWKTLTFRAIATTIDFTTNVIAIGNLVTASLLSAWNTLTGPWIYLGHELAWDYFGSPPAKQRDLPGIGLENAPAPAAGEPQAGAGAQRL